MKTRQKKIGRYTSNQCPDNPQKSNHTPTKRPFGGTLMTKPKLLCFLACLILLSQTSICVSQGKTSGDGLSAAPYPGSIAETYPLPSEVNSRTFYTADPIEKVKAHYAKSLGAFEEKSQSS